MTGKISRSIIAVSLIAILLSILTVLGISQPIFYKAHTNAVKVSAEFAAHGIEQYGLSYIENFNCSYRITVINSDGSVLYDSQNIGVNENHSQRKEFILAQKNGSGKAYRYSSTTGENTLYYAVSLSNGSVLRLADRSYSVVKILKSMFLPVCLVVLIIFGLSVIFAMRMTDKIIKPINSINLSNPTADIKYSELAPLTEKIRRQNHFISVRMSELAEKQEEFSLIIHNMSEGFLVIGKQHEVLSYNTSAVKMLGVDFGTEKISGNAIGTKAQLWQAVDTALGGEHSEQLINNDENYYKIIANPVYHSNAITGAVVVILDVTQKEKMDTMRREFTSNVSHELKTPLTSIRCAAEILKNGMVKAEDLPSFSGMIYDEAGRLVTLIDDILRLSQLDEESITEEKCSVDLYAVALSVAERLERFAAKQNITLNVEGEHCCISGVPTIIDEMVYNLCDNAVKYNINGGSVTVSVSKQSDFIRLTVADTGIGIPQNQLSRVFERFYRVDKSRSKAIGGTGLGLSIVKHAAAYHNADVRITSKENSGTTITVLFKA